MVELGVSAGPVNVLPDTAGATAEPDAAAEAAAGGDDERDEDDDDEEPAAPDEVADRDEDPEAEPAADDGVDDEAENAAACRLPRIRDQTFDATS